MKWIGITGGIATGKSTVSKMVHDLGGVVIDADILAREVVVPGAFGLEALVEVFGKSILNETDKGLVLNRSVLGKIIFQDPRKREIVEQILHPLIQWRSHQERENLTRQGLPRAFYDAALIFEKNLKGKFDRVILVSSSFEKQKARLIKRDGLSVSEAEKRIKAQMPLFEKAKLADYIIENDEDLKTTRLQLEEILKKI